jgi:hypothetical protein
MLISNPLKKLQKTSAQEVINEKVTEFFFFTFITVCKSFRRVTLFGMNFFTCVLESHFISISGQEGSVLSKKSKSLYPII